MFRSWILNTFMLNKRQSSAPHSLVEMNYKGCVSSKVKQYHWEILGPISRCWLGWVDVDSISRQDMHQYYRKDFGALLVDRERKYPISLHTRSFFGWDMKYKYCWPKNHCVDLFMKASELEQTRKLSWNLHVREFVHEWESIMDEVGACYITDEANFETT